MSNLYKMYHKHGLWYMEGIIIDCGNAIYIDSITKKYNNDSSIATNVAIDDIKSLVATMKIIKLCGSIDRAEEILDQCQYKKIVRNELKNAISEYRNCMTFR